MSLLRPGGFMKIGLYSEVARRHIVEVRKVIEQRGYRATPADIRRCRRDLMEVAGNANLIRLLTTDFFSISNCRDLLFHVQEHRMTLAEIETFLRANGLTFLGFDTIHPSVVRAYRTRFLNDPLHDRTVRFRERQPRDLPSMYQFLGSEGDWLAGAITLDVSNATPEGILRPLRPHSGLLGEE